MLTESAEQLDKTRGTVNEVLTSAILVRGYCEGKTSKDLATNMQLQDAVAHRLIMIAAASSELVNDTVVGNLLDWRSWVKDPWTEDCPNEMVFKIVVERIPELLVQLEAVYRRLSPVVGT